MSHNNSCILAIDTATGPCSVAVWKDNQVTAYIEDVGPSMQSARLLPMVEKALTQSGIDYGDLTSVACTVGPGSFTGIRVGLATANGIAFAANIPGLGFSTLEVMAFAASHYAPADPQYMLALLNAGKGECYYQGFRFTKEWRALYSPRVGPLEEATDTVRTPVIVAGNVGPLPQGFQTTPIIFPQAHALAALAASASSAQPLKPFYIRPPDAKPMIVDR